MARGGEEGFLLAFLWSPVRAESRCGKVGKEKAGEKRKGREDSNGGAVLCKEERRCG